MAETDRARSDCCARPHSRRRPGPNASRSSSALTRRPVAKSPSCWARSTGPRISVATVRHRPKPGWWSASGSRRRRRAVSPMWARKPGTSRTWWAPCVRATSVSTKCAPSSTWPPPRPSGSCVTRRSSARCVSSPMWPGCRPLQVTKPDSRQQHQGRYLRFNDEHRTMNAQLPAESYAATRAWIDALAGHGAGRPGHTLGPASLRRAHRDGPIGHRPPRPPRPAPTSWWSTPRLRPWSPNPVTRPNWPVSSSVTA